jgi:hypothetical protein
MRLVTRCAAGPTRCSESQREHETQAARLPVFGGWPGISQARPHLTTSLSRVALRVAAVWLRRGLTLYIESRTHRRKTAGRFLGCFIAGVCAAPSHPSGDDRWTLPYAETGTLSRWAHNVSPSRCTTGTAPHRTSSGRRDALTAALRASWRQTATCSRRGHRAQDVQARARITDASIRAVSSALHRDPSTRPAPKMMRKCLRQLRAGDAVHKHPPYPLHCWH